MEESKVRQEHAEVVTRINELKENKENMLEILKYQEYLQEYVDVVNAIAHTEFNRTQLLRGSAFSTATEIFNLGIIIGKRMERAKNKKIKTSRSVLLEQIRTLKLENIRFKTAMEKIYKDLDYSSTMLRSLKDDL